MENLKVITKRKKRLGRGYGSGKGGHTAGRGQKGQKSRRKIGVLFEGIKVRKSMLHRIPFQRGKAKNPAKQKPVVVSLGKLNMFKDGDKVNLESLVQNNIVSEADAKKFGVKLLNGKLEKKLTISLPVSESAKETIEKVGGKII